MDPSLRRLQTKRFVVEDSFTKVTSDGEPHAMMTLIAGVAGAATAIIILIILITLVACKKERNTDNCRKCATGIDSAQCAQKKELQRLSQGNNNSQRSSIYSISKATPKILSSINEAPDTDTEPISDSFVISNGNFGSNLNAAFVESEFDLVDSLRKDKKRTAWQNEVMVHNITKETVIDMTER